MKMPYKILAAGAAALAGAILGGGMIAAAPNRVPVAEAYVMRAQETGYCVIPGKPAELTVDSGPLTVDEPLSSASPTLSPEGTAREIVRTAELYSEIPQFIGAVPVIIGEAENAVNQAEAAPYSEDELEIFACAIYQEAGGNACSDLCRMYVGDVMLNRVNDPRFPNTLYEVLTQEHQYGLFWKTGIVWPSRASDPNEAAAVERAYDTARALLEGEHSELFGEGYIYQDTKPRGKDVIYLDGEYFGR